MIIIILNLNQISPLLKLYAKQLILINENNGYSNVEILNNHPSLKCWLKFLNISDNSTKVNITKLYLL